MKKLFLLSLFFVGISSALFAVKHNTPPEIISGAPPYSVGEETIPSVLDDAYDLLNWERPDKPLTVGIQVGHWKSEELPEELERLRGNTGATGFGKSEWEVNYEIAVLVKEFLESEGMVVDLLPATVPQDYWADIFVSVHADGHPDSTKSGFKAARPWRDFTQKADRLVQIFREEYAETTGMQWDEETITRNMRGYYGFSWWRFEHAIHPMTPAMIIETGFLTTRSDAEFLIYSPEIPAQAIANSVLQFLKETDPLSG